MSNGYQKFFQQAKKAAESGQATRRPFSLPREGVQGVRPRTALDDLMEKRIPKKKKAAPAPGRTPVEALRGRLRDNAKKSRRRPPLMKMLMATVGLLITGYGLYRISDVEKLVKNVEISMLGVAMAEEAPKGTAPAEAKADGKGTAPAAASAEKVEGKDSAPTPEDIDHFAKLNERQKELDAREAELNRMETELAKQKEELEKRLTQLDSTRRQISSVLEDRVQADDKKVDSLVQVYSNMKPQQAAKIFETMDEDLAIEILDG